MANGKWKMANGKIIHKKITIVTAFTKMISKMGPHHSFVKFVRQAVGDTFALKIEAQSGC